MTFVTLLPGVRWWMLSSPGSFWSTHISDNLKAQYVQDSWISLRSFISIFHESLCAAPEFQLYSLKCLFMHLHISVGFFVFFLKLMIVFTHAACIVITVLISYCMSHISPGIFPSGFHLFFKLAASVSALNENIYLHFLPMP